MNFFCNNIIFKPMLLLRRLPSLLFTYNYRIYLSIILIGTFVYLLFKRNLLCLNYQAWHEVQKVCKHVENQNGVGSLCTPLCFNLDQRSFKCHPSGSVRQTVFRVNLGDTPALFKSASTDVRSWHWFDNGAIKYPSEKMFLLALQGMIKNKLNLTLTQDAMLRLIPRPKEKDVLRRQREMENMWILFQDDEFLLSTIYSDKDVFPQVLGTCGSLFAVEYAEPFKDASPLLSFSDTKENWAERLKFSLEILDFLEKFETSFHETFYLCDIKLEYFGIVKDTNKLKFIDLDGIFPNSVFKKTFFHNQNCVKDADCNVYDCKFKCIKSNNKCGSYVVNSNLQIICEKVFLGWRLSNTVIFPGLLISQHTPAELASILRQCANLQKDGNIHFETSLAEIRERLINVLTEIEQIVSNDLLL